MLKMWDSYYCVISFVTSSFIVFNVLNTDFVYSDITVSGVQCGQKKCQINEYCPEYEKICKPCSLICTKEHHNFDEIECMKSCQDYLHNIKYMGRDGTSGSSESLEKLKGEVIKLSHMVTLTLTLVCFMFLVLAVLLAFQLYRWKIKKNITWNNLKSKLFKKSDPVQEPRSQDNKTTKPDLRLDISNISNNSEHSPATAITSISSRRPAEDSPLDYAYDNHAMSASPK